MFSETDSWCTLIVWGVGFFGYLLLEDGWFESYSVTPVQNKLCFLGGQNLSNTIFWDLSQATLRFHVFFRSPVARFIGVGCFDQASLSFLGWGSALAQS